MMRSNPHKIFLSIQCLIIFTISLTVSKYIAYHKGRATCPEILAFTDSHQIKFERLTLIRRQNIGLTTILILPTPVRYKRKYKLVGVYISGFKK